MSKKALGRGLQALLSDELGDNPSIKEVSITSIIPNPDQPRKDFDPQALNELANSLLVHGLLSTSSGKTYWRTLLYNCWRKTPARCQNCRFYKNCRYSTSLYG